MPRLIRAPQTVAVAAVEVVAAAVAVGGALSSPTAAVSQKVASMRVPVMRPLCCRWISTAVVTSPSLVAATAPVAAATVVAAAVAAVVGSRHLSVSVALGIVSVTSLLGLELVHNHRRRRLRVGW